MKLSTLFERNAASSSKGSTPTSSTSSSRTPSTMNGDTEKQNAETGSVQPVHVYSLRIFLMGVLVSMGGLIFGYDTGEPIHVAIFEILMLIDHRPNLRVSCHEGFPPPFRRHYRCEGQSRILQQPQGHDCGAPLHRNHAGCFIGCSFGRPFRAQDVCSSMLCRKAAMLTHDWQLDYIRMRGILCRQHCSDHDSRSLVPSADRPTGIGSRYRNLFCSYADVPSRNSPSTSSWDTD